MSLFFFFVTLIILEKNEKKIKKEKSLANFCMSVLKFSIIRLAFRSAMQNK